MGSGLTGPMLIKKKVDLVVLAVLWIVVPQVIRLLWDFEFFESQATIGLTTGVALTYIMLAASSNQRTSIPQGKRKEARNE